MVISDRDFDKNECNKAAEAITLNLTKLDNLRIEWDPSVSEQESHELSDAVEDIDNAIKKFRMLCDKI